MLSVHGLPAGTPAAVAISSAQGYQHSSSGPETLAGLPAGSYAVTALEVLAGGDRYVPAPGSQAVTVTPGGSTAVEVVYVLVTARLEISLAGLPQGAGATLALSGPGGYQHEISGTVLLTGLLPGGYSLHAPAVVLSGDQYQATPEIRDVVLPGADTIAVQVSVGYALATGRLAVEVSGVPTGAAAAIRVTGPGFDQLVTHSDTLRGLAPGSYSLTASSLSTGGYTYAALPASLTLGVLAEPAPVTAQVVYGIASGGLQVIVSGLPAGNAASLAVSGPAGFAQELTGSQLLTDLLPGTYTISAASVTAGGQLYAAAPASQGVSLAAGLVPQVVTVGYAPATASLTVNVSGLPNGAAASLSVTGPSGYAMQLNGSSTLSGLAPGVYSISGGSLTLSGFSYAPQPAQQSVTLSGGSSGSAGVSYTATSGSLNLSVSGLPGGTAANVSVTGPAGYAQTLSGSQLLQGLAPGSYSVSAAAVSSGGTSYSASPASQNLTLNAGAMTAAAVSYAASGGGATLDLTVNGVYLTQATQRYDGSVPLVAGRDAYLRAFALANQTNSATPPVRVRLYQGATLLQTYSIAASAGSVPLAPDESTHAASWNVLVPGALVQPGLRVLAEVDPAGTTAEANEGNNLFPVSGTPASVDVRALPTFALRFVPVLQQVNGLQGNVSAANQESYLGDLRKMLPVGATDIDIRAPYTTTAPALQSANANGAWNTILSELWALRAADASSRYYFGVVKVGYSSGVAGLGYVGGSAHTAMGWDFLPSATNVVAHEVGHNLSRQHAPCGGPTGTDPSYPYAGGQLGVWGLDVAAQSLKPPSLTDVMSYCGPNWISDYNWSGMLAYRQSAPTNAPDAAGAADGLLVWGRLTASGLVLEPSFSVPARPEHAPRPGDNRLELLGADGTLLRAIGFEAPELADTPGGERGFAFVVPLDPGLRAGLGGLRVVAGGRSATRLMNGGPAGDPAALLVRTSPQQVELRWDAARYPMVLVRDAATGAVLSFARGGTVRLWSAARDFDLQFSDGIRSTARAARVLR
ncbi:MAG TPA: M66 family metalloprotease [Gemmatimonadales bacterium]|nr:M66 family metalloprotease [Gemmatimonadales bacterium]